LLQLLDASWEAGAKICRVGENSAFVGDIRIINKAGLHVDQVCRKFDSGVFSQINSQLSWNIYISNVNEGDGELQIFDMKYLNDHKELKNNSEFGYTESVVQNLQPISIAPLKGQLVIFNSTNYHRVNPTKVSSPRISVTSFIGLVEKNLPIILWS